MGFSRFQRKYVPLVSACTVLLMILTILRYNSKLEYQSYYLYFFSNENSAVSVPAISVYPKETVCNPGIPCVYPEEVDFRIIVITFNRKDSVMKLLRSLDDLELDGDSAALEIWIDRDKQGKVDNSTLETLKIFKWKRGPSTVHVQKAHVGIYGQWIDTWRPSSTNSKELAVILEDDLSVSPEIYRWIKAVNNFYGKRKDYAGVTLQTDEQKAHNGGRKLEAPKNHTAFLYKCIGTWGFAPFPKIWSKFQDWFHTHINISQFHPYVPGIVPTEWYKGFEARGKADSMWEMWFIYFAHVEQLFTVYSNLERFVGDSNSCLSINRREVGLHYANKGPENLCKLLTNWRKEYISFPEQTIKLDWDGNQMNKYY